MLNPSLVKNQLCQWPPLLNSKPPVAPSIPDSISHKTLTLLSQSSKQIILTCLNILSQMSLRSNLSWREGLRERRLICLSEPTSTSSMPSACSTKTVRAGSIPLKSKTVSLCSVSTSSKMISCCT